MTTKDIDNQRKKGSVVQVLKARCRTVGICCCHSHNKLGDTALLAVASPFPARISQRNQIQDGTLQRCTSVHCCSVIFQSFKVQWMQQREGNTWQHFRIGCSAVIKELNVSGTSVSDNTGKRQNCNDVLRSSVGGKSRWLATLHGLHHTLLQIHHSGEKCETVWQCGGKKLCL